MRSNPTPENAQAAAAAQDAGMKAAEQRQQIGLGLQRRAIQQGKTLKTHLNAPKPSANDDTGSPNAESKTRGGAMQQKAREVKKETSKTSQSLEKRGNTDAGGDMGKTSKKRPKDSKKASGAINTAPENQGEQEALDALAENLYEQQRRATQDIEKIAKSTGWPVERIARIKDYVFNEEHKLIEEEPPQRFAASMGMIQSWRRMASGDPKALESHDVLLLEHEWLEMKIKMDNPGISHQQAHDMANEKFCYSKAEEAHNAKSKRLSISERTRRKGSILPGK